MKSVAVVKFAAALAVLVLLAGCPSPVGSYQSAGTYASTLDRNSSGAAFDYEGPERNPVVVIHGFLGSRLGSFEDGTPVWGTFSERAPSDEELRRLAHPMRIGRTLAELSDKVEPVDILAEAEIRLGDGLNFMLPGYRTALDFLVDSGYVDAARPLPAGKRYANLYSFAYDWRRDLPENAARLHKFLMERRGYLQQKYEDTYGIKNYDIQFDLVAHSMGGLLARYYLMYGGQDLPADGVSLPELNWDGAKIVDKLMAVGTPNDGYLDTLTEMTGELRLSAGGPDYPAGIIATFPSYYQMLPGISGGIAHYADDSTMRPLDLFDRMQWIVSRWGLADPANDRWLKVMLPDVTTPEARREIALDHLQKCLRRARQFRAALNVPGRPPEDVAMFLFVGDVVKTARTVLVNRLTGKVSAGEFGAGDGKVLASSARFDRRGRDFHTPFSESPIVWQAVSHVSAAHMGLFSSPEFWRNARYYLLMFPTAAQRERFDLNR